MYVYHPAPAKMQLWSTHALSCSLQRGYLPGAHCDGDCDGDGDGDDSVGDGDGNGDYICEDRYNNEIQRDGNNNNACTHLAVMYKYSDFVAEIAGSVYCTAAEPASGNTPML
jgi:hypothetical protein